ncbi:MAG: hypothetical protein IJO87_07700 [Eggerthellaceae bacterium]|nr:hypothetical protein [Eggerthellaceae bacterium]
MSRFSDVITLYDLAPVQDDEGITRNARVHEQEVFFNRHRVSMASRMAGSSEGIRRIASGEVRTIDYDGQESAVLDGLEYSVADANNQGDLTVLTLERRLSNG